MTETTASAADGLLHWEDFDVGQVIELGSRTVEKDEIISFARAFDPQPMHVDEKAAEESMFGRLFASGWHSCALLMRLVCDSILNKAAALGAPGIDEAKFMKPVFAGDTLTGRATCMSKRPLGSKPDVGACQFEFVLMNQSGEPALSWVNTIFIRRRQPGTPA